MRPACAAWLACLALAACGGAIAEPAPPRVPTTHRDPPSHRPTPAPHGETGAVVALAASAGDDEVRDVVIALVIAARDQDLEALRELFAPAVHFLATLRQGRAPASVAGSALAQQILSTSRLAQVAPDARVEDLIDPGSIRVEAIGDAFPGVELPRDLEPGDRIVRFTVTALGHRALAILAHEGSVAVVVRPGRGARIVAR